MPIHRWGASVLNPVPRYEALFKAGDLEGARREATQVHERNARDWRAMLTLARLALVDGEEALAESLLLGVTRAGAGEQRESRLVGAALHTRRGEWNQALELYRALVAEPSPPTEAFFGLGYVRVEQGDAAAAHAALAHAVSLEPRVALHHFQLARVLFLLDRLEEAFAHLELSLHLDPWHAPSYLVFARALEAGGELEAAEDLLRQGQKAVPDDVGLLKALADVRLARGNVRGAVSAAEARVRVEPEGVAALGHLARLRVTERRFLEALELCHQLEARGMSTGLSRSVEALVFEAREPPDVERALAAWREAVRLSPDDWMPPWRQALLLLRQVEDGPPEAVLPARALLAEAHHRAPQRPEPVLALARVEARLGARESARERLVVLLRHPSLEDDWRAQAEALLTELG
ncbi:MULTISPECIES: lipopolysaccharide assembly protein LapB [Corallococcus]|uniref:tetratricopeptide repeat protein n=1 Tax=Corallococcus TaxID=83461 RepID=UPI001F368761|nr:MULTISPECIES: tetratricopeptide repeat protein [Corallococcus]